MMRLAEARTAVLIIAALLVLAVCGFALLYFLHTRALAVHEPPTMSPAAAAVASESGVDLVDAASVAVQECARAVPPSIPDGTHASAAEMAAARAAFQEYDKATNAYVHCVDQAIDRVHAQYAAVASPAELKTLDAFGVGAHDTAIDQEQAVADQFNGQVRAYRAKHPQS
jgi:hypothetical protein